MRNYLSVLFLLLLILFAGLPAASAQELIPPDALVRGEITGDATHAAYFYPLSSAAQHIEIEIAGFNDFVPQFVVLAGNQSLGVWYAIDTNTLRATVDLPAVDVITINVMNGKHEPGQFVITVRDLPYGSQPVEPTAAAPSSSPLPPDATTLAPTPSSTSQPLVQENGICYHIVQPGENLFRIAETYNLSLQAILSANPQITNENIIHTGNRIVIPDCGN